MDTTKKCLLCNYGKDNLVRLDSMETYMQFRIKNKIKTEITEGFVCIDCREQLRKELEKESGIKID